MQSTIPPPPEPLLELVDPELDVDEELPELEEAFDEDDEAWDSPPAPPDPVEEVEPSLQLVTQIDVLQTMLKM